LLTKRPENTVGMWDVAGGVDRMPGGRRNHVWLGTSVGTQETADVAVPRLVECRELAAVLFLSVEPLLGPIQNLPLAGIDWVIVGGESGRGARPRDEAWVLDIKTRCDDARVPFFFKQWGGVNKKRSGRELSGQNWGAVP